MQASLLVMSGTSLEQMPFNAGWKEHIHEMVYKAIPVFAVQVHPYPVLDLCCERRRSPDVQALQNLLRNREQVEQLLQVWCTFVTTDDSLAESFLLIATPGIDGHQFSLRFQHARHLDVLEAIEKTGQLALVTAPGDDPVLLKSNVPDVHVHLDRIRTFRLNSTR